MNKTQFSWNCAFRMLVAAAASAFAMTASADVLVYLHDSVAVAYDVTVAFYQQAGANLAGLHLAYVC